MSEISDILVLIKQVPDTASKAGLNPDGTIDRAKAKRMLNPFDRFALQAALHTKKTYGGKVTALSMGPPPAVEILLEAIENGVDQCYLLSDRRLAASDTLATAYALHKCVQYIGKFDLIFTGLQTTDGDTAQVGPQIAERLNLAQVTYCEDFSIEAGKLHARRIVEGGHQDVICEMPALVTIANAYHPLEYKTIRGARLAQELNRDEALKNQYIHTITLDDVNADPELSGLKGSPTIVAHTDKVGQIGGQCVMHQGKSVDLLVKEIADSTNIKEFVKQ
jgi:electron transfer flavoprotein beta subunit